MTYKFYDTCSLLLKADSLFEDESPFAISSITLEEIAKISASVSKDADIKLSAKKLIYTLEENYGKYEIITFKKNLIDVIEFFGYEITNNIKILISAKHFQEERPDDTIIFVTNDLYLKHIAPIFFYDKVESVVDASDDYPGYKDIAMSQEEMAIFYSNLNQNTYNLYINEYIIVRDSESNEVKDGLRWTGSEYRQLDYGSFSSQWFGEVKPIKGDMYQLLVADSFINNKITLVKGPAGSGKTYLSLGYLMNRLEKGKIDKIIIFCNTVATANSAKLGYYPGTRNEKLLDSQIGNLLISKFGGRLAVEDMINTEKLILLPLSDIRGYDTTGMKAGIYISEAQNLDISLMKLVLQRIGDDAICIVDGDCKTQVDDIHFAGSNNGMRRLSQVYRGEDIYGEVALKNIHRSQIARIAEQM